MESASTPVKPWEINRVTSNNNFGALRSSNITDADANFPNVTNSSSAMPPPVPPRPQQNSLMNNSSSYYSPYNSMGSYGGYSGYGGGYGGGLYGMGGGMYGGSMFGNTGYNRGINSFSQRAEESTRNAFQSVESIVRAFSAISGMFESTFGAVYSSFRAVLDVADHFSRVRATFSDILSSLAVIRLVKFLYRRAMRLLRLRSCDDAWDVANAGHTEHHAAVKKHPGSWPILLFFSVILGGPYLIWRLLRGEKPDKSENDWAKGIADHVVAVAQYHFSSESEDEISFVPGETIILAPKEQQPNIQNWLLASKDGETIGMVPANYVKILGKRRGKLTSDMPVPVPPTQTATSNPQTTDTNPLKAPSMISNAQSEATIDPLNYSDLKT